MARKLKTFETSLGFYNLAIAAPLMKAALYAWGASSNLCHHGVAKETDDLDVVAATMLKPGHRSTGPRLHPRNTSLTVFADQQDSLDERPDRAARRHRVHLHADAAQMIEQGGDNGEIATQSVEVVDHDDLDRAGAGLLYQGVECGPRERETAQAGIVENDAMASPFREAIVLTVLQLEGCARAARDGRTKIDRDVVQDIGLHLYNIQLKPRHFPAPSTFVMASHADEG